MKTIAIVLLALAVAFPVQAQNSRPPGAPILFGIYYPGVARTWWEYPLFPLEKIGSFALWPFGVDLGAEGPQLKCGEYVYTGEEIRAVRLNRLLSSGLGGLIVGVHIIVWSFWRRHQRQVQMMAETK
jgi:hypothetical protein